jgi:hypothetical protein
MPRPPLAHPTRQRKGTVPAMTFYRIVPQRTNPYPLGRHVNHDPRSLAYEYRAPVHATYAGVDWQRHVPIFDQGQLGSCTGNAAVGCIGTGAFFSSLDPQKNYPFAPNEAGALACYEAATVLDPYPGQYPPTDTGSDGNSVAMALKNAGMISGYTHALSFDAAMAALQTQPVIFGLSWYNDMFTPGADGTLSVSGALAGGHEVVLSAHDPHTARVRLDNSWGEGWGLGGSAWLQLADFKKLLKQDGDVTVFAPITAPAPQPTPPTPTAVTAADVASAVRKALTDLKV